MSDQVFLDTNVLVYMFDRREARKRRSAHALVRELISSHRATVSFQVVQEFLNVALHRFREPLEAQDLRTFLDSILWPMCGVFPDLALYTDAISIREETGWTFYDSLIVSAAATAGCALLFSEDLQAGRVIRGVEIRNPFA